MLKKVSLETLILFFSIPWWMVSSKELHFFTVIFDKFNVSLLNFYTFERSVSLFPKSDIKDLSSGCWKFKIQIYIFQHYCFFF